MRHRLVLATLFFASITAIAPSVSAHPGGHDGTPAPLHVDDSYDECFFDLHPELTQAEFDEFAREGSVVMHDYQLGSAEALGRGEIAISLDYTSIGGIDDSKGAWNNTMSHPTDDHWLGHTLAFPRLSVRMGVSRRVDVGVWGTLAPGANYGFIGLESKVVILEQGEDMPVSFAVRPTAVGLLGPDELLVADTGIDFSVSRHWKGLSPYVGFAAHTTIAFERTDDVDLDPGTAAYTSGFVGLSYQWKHLRVAAQAEAGPLTTYALRLGGSF
jgi:hypothetical protein